MFPYEPNLIVREEATSAFERMFRAVELVKRRLERTCNALQRWGIPYAIIGGNAVAVWVSTVDDGAVRNTRDVDILLMEEDLERATLALTEVGFVPGRVLDVTVFLDGPNGKPSQGIHIVLAGKRLRADYPTLAPSIDQVALIEGRRVITLEALIEMKLNSFRDKDRTHLRDMISVGLIDSSWPVRFDRILGDRLQELLDNPEG